MVKNKNDKTKLRNWEEGDIFALKINNQEYPKYNGRYIIFIHSIIQKENWKMTFTTNSFRAKITKNTQLPTTREEIEDLEYIKTGWDGYLFEKKFHNYETKMIKPDKYNLIYKYLFIIKTLKHNIPKNLIYLGNFNLKLPENEYIPYSQYHSILYSFWNEKYSKITESLLKKYEELNLRKNQIFSCGMQKNFLEEEKQKIKFWQKTKKRMEEIDNLYGKGLLHFSDEEKYTKNSETYVGADIKNNFSKETE